MEKIISVEKLTDWIEKRQDELSDRNFHSMVDEYDETLCAISSLQQEVDLEKEIKAEWDVIDTDLLRFEEFKAICYKYYELGLNAKKEK